MNTTTKIAVQVNSHCMVTITRPNGSVDVVRHPVIITMTPQVLAKANAAMAAAGRGKITAYENVMREAFIEVSKSELAREAIEADTRAITRRMAYGE